VENPKNSIVKKGADIVRFAALDSNLDSFDQDKLGGWNIILANNLRKNMRTNPGGYFVVEAFAKMGVYASALSVDGIYYLFLVSSRLF
jgi:hypothetical protein